jgi:hypothetical protein
MGVPQTFSAASLDKIRNKFEFGNLLFHFLQKFVLELKISVYSLIDGLGMEVPALRVEVFVESASRTLYIVARNNSRNAS